MNTATTSTPTAAANIAALEAKLSEYDYVVCIDSSGSMGEADAPGNRTRWAYMQETGMAFTRDMEKLDSDGIGVVLFGGANIIAEDGVNSTRIKELFEQSRPMGSTPMDKALTAALKLLSKSSKKKFITIYTDGVPDDKEAVAKVIRDQSNRQQNDDECTFLFVQVGKDNGASAYLRQLDDDLKGAKFDIVDAKTIEEAEKFNSTVELIAHAIND